MSKVSSRATSLATRITLLALAGAAAAPLLAQPPEGGQGGGMGGGMGARGGRGMDPVEMIMRADLDGDGKVTKAEYAKAQFDRLDRNKDGVIDDKDFAEMPPQMAERIKDRVMRADANGDGKVTPEELGASVNMMFDRFDTNHDGAITREEAQAAVERMRAGQ
ncbi:MAG: EF-hand domain-containing protein [Sphingomonadales bacterium]|nr:EF-hand domain-containing protein [Sphingomonadales bacterium]MDE2169905.1 EF-hand domain-containing protein [Sphingomonadales bacterium]